MPEPHPRLRTALVSLDPTTKRPAWHGAPTPLGVLRGVSPATAMWRPVPRMVCIREITVHIAFWENSVANRLSGASNRLPYRMGKPGWLLPSDELTREQWKEDRRILAETHGRLVASVEAFDPERLDRPPGKQTGRAAIEYIHGVAEHSLYHGGQIKMLKRLAKTAGVS